MAHLPADDDVAGGLDVRPAVHIPLHVEVAGNLKSPLELLHASVDDFLGLHTKQVIFDVQDAVHAGGEGQAAPVNFGVDPLGDIGAEHRGAGECLPRHIHARRPLLWGADHTDHRPLPDGLHLAVGPEVHLAAVLDLHPHIRAPLEQLGELTVGPWIRELSAGYGEYVEIAQGKLPLKLLFREDTVEDALIMQVLPKGFKADPAAIVFRGEQTGVGAHPVCGEEKPRLSVHGPPFAIQHLLVPVPTTFFEDTDKLIYGFAVIWILRLCLFASCIQF